MRSIPVIILIALSLNYIAHAQHPFGTPLPVDHESNGQLLDTHSDFDKSLDGMTAYFTNVAHDNYRDANIQAIPVETRIAESIGLDNVPLGNVTSTITKSVGISMTLHEDMFDTGAIAQYVVAEGDTDRLMVAIHGCTSSPYRVMGITDADYTNQMGAMAHERGWTVIAPYMMSECKHVDDFESIGAFTSGVTPFSYEIQKIQHILDQHTHTTVAVYGISYGGVVATLLAALDERIDIAVISGYMVQDFPRIYKSFLIPLKDNAHQGEGRLLRRHVRTEEMLLNFLSDGGKKLILEAGAQDWHQYKPDKTLEFFAKCRAQFSGCDERAKLVWFDGGHETAPFFTLDLLSDSTVGSTVPDINTYLPKVSNE